MTPISEEGRKRIAESRRGKHWSDEIKKRISEKKKGKHASPRTEIKPGQRISPRTEFVKGQPAHNRKKDDYFWDDKRTGYRMARSLYTSSGWAHEQTVMVERVLGRHLKPGEEVHHVNARKSDNRNSNFVVCTGGYHRTIERLMATIYQLEHFAKLSHRKAVAEAHMILLSRQL